jgi:hypothetical protein
MAAAITALDKLAVDNNPLSGHICTADFQPPQCEAIGRPTCVKRHPDWRVVVWRLEDTDCARDKLTVADAPPCAHVGLVFHCPRIAVECTVCP